MKKIFITLLLLPLVIFARDDLEASKVYQSIKDICHPTTRDYLKIEQFLKEGKRTNIKHIGYGQYQKKIRELKLVSDTGKVVFKIIPVNCDLEHKENCLLLYCTWNQRYPESLEKLCSIIEKSDFVGHIIFRIGGFPNVEAGDLALSHIPYSFKVCAFKEASRLGYKRALWLDSSMRPFINLNTIFNRISRDGFFCYYADWAFTNLASTPEQWEWYGLTEQELKNMTPIALGIIGIDFTIEKSQSLFNEWYDKTKNNPQLSFASLMETTLLSYLVNKSYKVREFPSIYGRVYNAYQDNIGEDLRPTPQTLEFSYDKWEVESNWGH
ncbi:hypothetical protein K0U07_00435 [bacterium]|nr:hypothetical protein [bacterium]